MSNVYEMARGETEVFTLEVRNAAGLVDLTNAKIYFTARGLDDAIVLEKKSTAAGGGDAQIEIPDQTANSNALLGKAYLKIGHADSDLRPTARWADCWVVTAGGEYIQIDEHSPFYITGAETRSIP